MDSKEHYVVIIRALSSVKSLISLTTSISLSDFQMVVNLAKITDCMSSGTAGSNDLIYNRDLL